jgi:HKD family nuclease
MPNAFPTTTLALWLVTGVTTVITSSAIAQQQLAVNDEQPLKPEKNPPGDIPDNQVFIDYVSTLGFSLKVPEGWASLLSRWC